MNNFIISLKIFIVLSIVAGIMYPAVMLLFGQVFFPRQSNGSLVYKREKPLGSEIIGQEFTDLKYFHGRLSGTPSFPYNPMGSSGSNLSQTNPVLANQIADRIKFLMENNPEEKNIPVDLIFSSASGLDPDISLEAAYFQVKRIANLRNIPAETITELIARLGKDKDLGFLGEKRINVLELNLKLDEVA